MSFDIKRLAEFSAGAVERFAKAQGQLSATGDADNGRVRVTLTGDFVMTEVTIAPATIAQHRADQIGQLVVSAYGRARTALETKVHETIRRFAREAGIDLSSLGG